MQVSPAEFLDSFRAAPVGERGRLFESIIREFVSSNGSQEAIRLMLANVFDSKSSLIDRQAETLAAFARLPKDVAAAMLTPIDPTTFHVDDCLSEEEVDRILAETNR